MADPSAVGRALQNLLQNALKYGGEPPRIEIRARPRAARPAVRLRSAARRSRASRSAGSSAVRGSQDQRRRHGPGIPPRDLPHIFEPFYRGADAVSRQIHGSGLGLSLVQRIVQQHGGRVTVTSEPGQGSRFTLYLPVAPEAEAVATHAAGQPLRLDR